MLAGPTERVVLAPHFDLRVLGFTASVSVATALQSRAGTARVASRIDPVRALRVE